MPLTDHTTAIAKMREEAQNFHHCDLRRLAREVAADLLEMHDDTGISLDTWVAARELVETFTGSPITENGV
jgi:hypothetical protein